MSITTKTGDDGTTALFGNKRLPKSHPQIEAYGMVDEATSFIGLVHEHVSEEDKDHLTTIQQTLYNIMAHLSGAPVDPSLITSATTHLEKNRLHHWKHRSLNLPNSSYLKEVSKPHIFTSRAP